METGSSAGPKPFIARNWRCLLLGVLFSSALLLRTCGLSNDLDRNIIYHPDTPKQVQAAMRFLSGDFYIETGNRDYDGYPYFSSQIAAGIFKIYLPLHSRVIHHLGLHTVSPPDTWLTLFWIIRFWNSLVSALSVLLIYSIGKRTFGPTAGLLAALLLSVFPLDIASSHYAMSDPSAAFFALVTVWFALNIYESGRYRDYALATVFSVCSFSAKYNGVVSATAVILAHLLVQPSFKDLLNTASLKRILIMAVMAPLTFIATTPASWEAPGKAIPQILAFLSYTSTFKIDEQITQLSFAGKALYSLGLNGPAIVAIFTLPVILLAGVQIILMLRSRNRLGWILLPLPVLYLIIGLLFKPVIQASYHTLISAFILLLASGMLANMLVSKNRYAWPRIAALLILAWIILQYGTATAQHLFYFQHNDSRVVTAEWLKENTPNSFRKDGGRYSYIDRRPYESPEQNNGIIWVNTDGRQKVDPADPVIEFVTLYDTGFNFRNFSSTIIAQKHPWIEAEHTPIHLQKLPSSIQASIVPLSLNYYLRSPLLIPGQGKSITTFLSETPLESVLVAYKSGETGNQVDLEIGGQSTHLSVHQSKDFRLLKNLKPDRPGLPQGYAYSLHVSTLHRNGLLHIAFTPLEKGLLYYDLGEYQQAARSLEALDHPTARLIHAISSLKSGATINPNNLPDVFRQSEPLSNQQIRDLYGIAPAYIDDLSAIKWDSDEFTLPKHQRLIFETKAKKDTAVLLKDWLETPICYLQEGMYTLSVSGLTPVEGNASIEISFYNADPEEKIWSVAIPTSSPANQFMIYTTTFLQSKDHHSGFYRIEAQGTVPVVIDTISIQPDAAATLNRLKAIIQHSE